MLVEDDAFVLHVVSFLFSCAVNSCFWESRFWERDMSNNDVNKITSFYTILHVCINFSLVRDVVQIYFTLSLYYY